MSFVDISNRWAVIVTYTNRKCNIWDFRGPISGFGIFLAYMKVHPGLVGRGVYFMTFLISQIVCDLWGVYFMSFVDISNRWAVIATYTNRKCNIWNFRGPISGFAKSFWVHMKGHPRLVGVYFMTFVDISNRLSVKATCTNRKCNI